MALLSQDQPYGQKHVRSHTVSLPALVARQGAGQPALRLAGFASVHAACYTSGALLRQCCAERLERLRLGEGFLTRASAAGAVRQKAGGTWRPASQPHMQALVLKHQTPLLNSGSGSREGRESPVYPA